MKDDGGKETGINNIIKSNEILDSELYLISLKLSIYMITNLYIILPNHALMRVRSSLSFDLVVELI